MRKIFKVKLQKCKRIKEIFHFSVGDEIKEHERTKSNGHSPIETNRNCTIFNRRFASRFPSEATKPS